MKRTQRPEAQVLPIIAAPKSQEEKPRLILRIEELESRLAPQSTTSILD
jgi:hypothetical protein